MIIIDVPKQFQQKCNYKYPPYSIAQNMEEILFKFICNNNPQLAKYYYLPIFWTDYYILHNWGKDIDELTIYLNSLDKSKKYFTIVQYDCGIFINENFDLDITIFGVSGGLNNINTCNRTTQLDNNLTINYFSGNKPNFIIPLLTYPYIKCTNSNKEIYCSFVGSFITHPCRIQLLELLNSPDNNNKFKFAETTEPDIYFEILNKSLFTLCPRGYGYTSYRLFEAIQCNSIPVYIWEDECVLPYTDIINWNDFAVIIHSNEIKYLPDILNRVNIEFKLNQLKKIQYMFKYDFVYEYIIKSLI